MNLSKLQMCACLNMLNVFPMKTCVTITLVLFSFTLLASPESYESIRSCVMQQNHTNTIPEVARVFVCPNYHDTFILHYHTNLTIRQIIDKSEFKGDLVQVTIFRKSAPTIVRTNFANVHNAAFFAGGAVFSATVQPTNNPEFHIEPEDALLIQAGPINTW
mgnify:CR=1 FL=1